MSHTTPATYLMWSVMFCMLGVFLIFHLWKFDKFKCLKFSNSPHSGAFKRLMTYTYLLSVPCLISYSVGYTVIKYQEGFVVLPVYGIIPKPWQMWSQTHKAAILPLYLLFTVSWGFEMVTHLEELCFWLFLVNSGSGSVQQDWFQSSYFKTWLVGSITAVVYMPLVTILTREDPLKCEAYTFLAGSLGSLSLTLWFMPVLWNFPSFINRLQRCGVDRPTIVRLTRFHELNCVRVVCRYLFVLPLLVLSIDGIRPHQHRVNDSTFWTEFFATISAIGCGVSSGLTLVIFFPRSVEAEVYSRTRHASRDNFYPARLSRSSPPYTADEGGRSLSKLKSTSLLTGSDMGPGLRVYPLDLDSEYSPVSISPLKDGGLSPVFSPNRRMASGAVVEGRVVQGSPTRVAALLMQEHEGSVHPYLRDFTSPIDITSRRVYVKRQNGSFSV